MDLNKLKEILSNHPSYRLKQATEAVLGDLVSDWEEIKALPKILREELGKKYPLEIKADIVFSKDKMSAKTLVFLRDGLKTESVLMKYGGGRNTVCVSSQVGCAMGCTFCATGQAGFKRNLSDIEIIEQVVLFGRILKKTGERVSNIVFMGMGEPFLNYDNVISAIRTLNEKKYFNIAARRISISTVGIVEGIERLSRESLQVNLAISLHAPDNALRSKIIPANKKYPIEEIFKALDKYVKKTGRRVMIEYIMIKDLNDSLESAHKLARLLEKIPKKFTFVNLIHYNPTGNFKSSDPSQIKIFKKALESENIETGERYKFGRDIRGACGQLATEN